MSAVVSPITLTALSQPPKPITTEVAIGKDILELLAGSMYVEPLNIYREYIQNAADAIDQARDAGLLFDEPAGIKIRFDHAERTIRIRDNGISIPAAEFVRRLVTIGGSQKRGTKFRGFRGVGRLSGLGYCQELVFRGKAEGDSKVTELRWDARSLRDKMRDPNYTGDLSILVKDIVTETKVSATGFPNRFFEVELRKITRSRNDVLLNEDLVRSYIAQTAPVAFAPDFSFAHEIDTVLQKHGIRPPIQIELEDGRGHIHHRVHDHFDLTESVRDTIRGVEFIEIVGSDGELSAVGWIADHSYSGSIPKRLGLGGIRLRVGNVQVGDESILTQAFPESRFCGWVIGDIHILTSKISPNGRRDDFEPGPAYAHLQTELAIHARRLTSKIRERSSQRNQLRTVEQHCGAVEDLLEAAKSRPIHSLLANVINELSAERFERAQKDAARFAQGSAEEHLASARLGQIQSRLNTLGCGSEKDQPIRDDLIKPMSAVLRTIMTAAKTPAAGVDLSMQVFNAFVEPQDQSSTTTD